MAALVVLYGHPLNANSSHTIGADCYAVFAVDLLRTAKQNKYFSSHYSLYSLKNYLRHSFDL
jgi:hypothetical protein